MENEMDYGEDGMKMVIKEANGIGKMVGGMDYKDIGMKMVSYGLKLIVKMEKK